jgi:hypothetical protein
VLVGAIASKCRIGTATVTVLSTELTSLFFTQVHGAHAVLDQPYDGSSERYTPFVSRTVSPSLPVPVWISLLHVLYVPRLLSHDLFFLRQNGGTNSLSPLIPHLAFWTNYSLDTVSVGFIDSL